VVSGRDTVSGLFNSASSSSPPGLTRWSIAQSGKQNERGGFSAWMPGIGAVPGMTRRGAEPEVVANTLAFCKPGLIISPALV